VEHVSDDLLERYALDRTSESETAYVEEHLLLCDRCRERFASEEQYTTAIRGALRAFATELIAAHEVEGRPVNLFVRAAGPRWIARISGPRLEGGMSFESREEAEAYCRRAFRDMFPEHRCGPGCFSPP
jgi:anti-sigma factor RsiW